MNDILKRTDLPRDAKVVALILKSMGVEDYEPRVLNQFLEFLHRYTTDVLQDAQVFCEHSNKTEIDLDDVRLAIQSRVNQSFTQPPSREVLLELAHKKNSIPLPLLPKSGVHLPPEAYCLTASNFQLEPESN